MVDSVEGGEEEAKEKWKAQTGRLSLSQSFESSATQFELP